MFDLIVRNAKLWNADESSGAVDIGVRDGRYAAIEPELRARAALEVDVAGKLLSPGFVETHIHLDKSCTIERCGCEKARFPHGAMQRVSAIKHTFTVEDVHARARRTLEKCILHGTTLMRTHVEVDPKVGLRGFEGVKALIDEYAWAIDVEICVMPQEGLLNNPGTDELMIAALKSGARVVGAAPGFDSDPAGQIRRVFEMAREFDVDVDMHLDTGASGAHLDTRLVCELADKYGWGGRVTVGHVTKVASMPLNEVDELAARMAQSGVALTVLPSTDLYLMGRDQEYNVRRGVVDANYLTQRGVNCSVSSNNILNAFTPYGDGQLIRQANLYANVVQRGNPDEMRDLWTMFTTRAATMMRREDYGIALGAPADFVVVDAANTVDALRQIAPTLMGYKAGRRTYTREAAVLHRPA
ncbi:MULTISPECIES: amidohydrolase family protein [unclassified Achromobacter]|uniref:amidohydrolase family protein n=1 Tax=unclassified Achromobacter TaxID=2626865 RepID=UPI000B51CC9A|nr:MULTISPECIES: amidohydrolase family protein [unclassified Achromobacter]OWT80707.1 amidohydrolase [Achromobacter sp. HZ34]OWT81223.1 amidohydrolase [Achromobacter sp. HZ28]